MLTDPKNGAVKTFNFDNSFWTFDENDEHYAKQVDVFNNLGIEVLDNAFSGYNACVFAYGQTGSGKTYTMMGIPSDPGINPRICINLFERIQANENENVSYKVELSYMEIYNEQVRDLLKVGPKKKPLRVREHKVLGPYVEGLTKLAVADNASIETLMAEGNKSRTTAATAMNAESSRSHAVITLILTQSIYDPASKQTGEKASRICLVDLAGSERQAKTKSSGAQLKEGANINKSLTTLGLVINALAGAGGEKKKSKKSKEHHIPYRDSVLTFLLKDNLGGNAKTVMIATLSPASDNFDETLSTLRYADRAKQIVNNAIVNEDPNQKMIRELREELELLRSQVGPGGGSAGATSEEALALREKLLETEGMLAEMTMSWEQKLAKSQDILAEHQKLLSDHGAQVSGSGAGLSLQSSLPHFVSISSEFETEITIYTLKEGITRMGQCENPP